jgi:integrase/recombinase XerD
MDQKNCLCCTSVYRPNDVPFADERERYLRYCAEQGATPASLKIKRNELLWIAKRLDPDAHLGIGIEVLQQIGNERQSLHGAVTAVRRVVDIGRPESNRPIRRMDARRARIRAIDGGAMEPYHRQLLAMVRADEP